MRGEKLDRNLSQIQRLLCQHFGRNIFASVPINSLMQYNNSISNGCLKNSCACGRNVSSIFLSFVSLSKSCSHACLVFVCFLSLGICGEYLSDDHITDECPGKNKHTTKYQVKRPEIADITMDHIKTFKPQRKKHIFHCKQHRKHYKR